jgi:hypothetical protein
MLDRSIQKKRWHAQQEVIMQAGLRIGCLFLLLLGTGCAGKTWTGPGEYLVKNPGTVIAEGPFPDAVSCNAKLPALPRDQTVAVCIFLPQPLKRGI